jgi:hypothetical protein
MASTSGMSSILHGGPITVQPGSSLDVNDLTHLYNVRVQYAGSESTGGKKRGQRESWGPARRHEESEVRLGSKRDWERVEVRLKLYIVEGPTLSKWP